MAKTARKKPELDDYQLLLVCCIFASLLWSWVCFNMCWTYFDQFIYAVFPVGLIGIAFVVKKYRLIEK